MKPIDLQSIKTQIKALDEGLASLKVLNPEIVPVISSRFRLTNLQSPVKQPVISSCELLSSEIAADMDSTMVVDIVPVNGSGSGSGSEESGGSPKNAKEVPIPKSKKTKSTAMKRKRKSRAVVTRERSQVWQHFTKEDHPIIETVDGKETVVGNTKRAQCKYCPTHLACHSTNNGTSSLRKHIEQVCTGYPGRTDLSKGQTHLNFDGSDDVVLKWSQDNYVIAATEMIVIDELLFIAIERQGFRRFCKVAVPNFTIP